MIAVQCGRPRSHLQDESSGLSTLHSPSRGEAPIVEALWCESWYDGAMGEALKINACMVNFHTPISDASTLGPRTKLQLAKCKQSCFILPNSVWEAVEALACSRDLENEWSKKKSCPMGVQISQLTHVCKVGS